MPFLFIVTSLKSQCTLKDGGVFILNSLWNHLKLISLRQMMLSMLLCSFRLHITQHFNSDTDLDVVVRLF